MPALEWGRQDNRWYEQGVDHGVLYPKVGPGVVWNGLVSVEEASIGGSMTSYFVDGIKYMVEVAPDTYNARVEAFLYPNELDDERQAAVYGFSYQTLSFNGEKDFRKIHLVYNAFFTPDSTTYKTLGDSTTPSMFLWDLSTTPEAIPNRRATAHLIVDLDSTNPYLFEKLEEILYGSDTVDPHLPTAAELEDLFRTWVSLKITNLGDGSFSAEWMGVPPNRAFTILPDDTIQFHWPSVSELLADDTHTIESL